MSEGTTEDIPVKIARMWPIALTMAAVIGQGYLAREQIASHDRRLDAVETEFHQHMAAALVESEHNRATEASVRAIEPAIQQMSGKLDRLCVAMRPKCREE